MHSKNIQDYKIATLGSHSALQILKGARDEGFKTLCVVTPKTRPVYEHYGVVDEFVEIPDYRDFMSIQDKIKQHNGIIIPHGSFVSYLGHEKLKTLDLMYFGTKGILEWEADRKMERQWLDQAGLRQPRIFNTPEEIDCGVIIKFHGAGGGFGYFLARSTEEFYERIKEYPDEDDYVIQEYIVGVPMYIHYFYSPLTDELEIMSFDKRYEANADSIGRIAARDQLEVHLNTSYTVTGNVPIVVRESLLPGFFKIGRAVVEKSRDLAGKGLFGPFCLEGIMTNKLDYYVFEISARIVAGTNPFTHGSPYTWLRYNEPMSTGRRIAREIKAAIENGELEKVLG